MEPKDYYAVLGVPRDADAAAIKDAFRELALKLHPDRNKEPGAEDRFKEITEAYAVLSDPRKRAEYDSGGLAGVAGYSAEDLFGNIKFDEIFAGHGFDFGFDFAGDSIFDRLFGRRRRGSSQGESIQVALEVPLERILHGGDEIVRLTHRVTCTECHGSGAAPGTVPKTCEACGGTGQHTVTQQRKEISVHQVTPCAACGGRGHMIQRACPSCHGTGEVDRDEEFAVKIPPGIEEGMSLRIPGHGAPSPTRDGKPGDLLVVVHAAPDSRFVRRDDQLWSTQTVGVVDATLGTSLRIPTITGEVLLKVPPSTQPDTVLRVRGQGLPKFGGNGRGDLFVVVRVQIPEKLTSGQRKLFEQLRALESPRRKGA
jgi:molecular chaperone DnaJ